MKAGIWMPSIDDLVSVAEAFQKSPVYIDRDRCVAVRNRNASCRRCVDACPCDAIEVMNNEITLDVRACSACGACTAVCPTGALVPLRPSDDDLFDACVQAAGASVGRAVIACARISSRREADPTRYAEVPCLARVDESVLMRLAAEGVREIVLVDGACATCRYRAIDEGVNITCGAFQQLVGAQGAEIPISRTSAFPHDMLIEDATGLFGTTRRDFFSETARSARDLVSTAAKAALESELADAKELSIGARLRAGENGALPTFEIRRHTDIVNAMDALGQSVVEEVVARVFATVEIDVEKCNGCGMCAVFCPTAAIKRDERKKPYTNPEYLEFWASECIQCNLCQDVCWKKCLKVSPVVPTKQLFSFDPVVFDLRSSAGASKPFGLGSS